MNERAYPVEARVKRKHIESGLEAEEEEGPLDVKQVLSKEIDAVQENENGKDEEVEGGILLVVEAESRQL
jgi:hypothetical protein